MHAAGQNTFSNIKILVVPSPSPRAMRTKSLREKHFEDQGIFREEVAPRPPKVDSLIRHASLADQLPFCNLNETLMRVKMG